MKTKTKTNMKIPIRVMATRPAAPILLRHVAAAVLIPLAACGVAYLITLAVMCG